MSRCKHRIVDRRYWHNDRWCDDVHNGEPCAVVCIFCREWLPIGQSNDEDPRVAVEIRAAEIAAGVKPAVNPAIAYAASCGYDDKQTPFAWGCGWVGLENAWLAGYLAREIVEHDKEAG